MRIGDLPKPVEWAITAFVVTIISTFTLAFGSFSLWISYLLLINMRSW